MMKLSGLVALSWVAVLATSPVLASEARRESAGSLSDGRPVEVIVLSNDAGVSARILTYGATLQSLIAPDRNGVPGDIVLGYDDVADYEARSNFFGVTVGRYANRIAGGRFTLDGQTYQLPLNDGPNSLHGGGEGFDTRLWRVVSVEGGDKARVTLALTSPDGESGYPGRFETTVTYSLGEDGSLEIAFEGRTDRATVVNMTNHALFNLAGEGSPEGAMMHLLSVPAGAYTPVDATLIPTGERRPVEETVFDFRTPRVIAAGLRDGRDDQIRIGRGYDHNFALDKGLTPDPGLAARLEDPGSGRVLEVFTTEPGLQVYTGNFLDGTLTGKGGHVYRMGDGIALEPQKFPNAPNEPGFVSARVDPDRPYRHVMIYRVSVAADADRPR